MTKLEQLLAQHCPNGVEYIQLNTICEIYDGTHQTPQYTDSGVKFVSVENIGALYETTKYISEEAYSKYKIKPQLNDVFMTRIGSIGVCAVVDRTEDLAYYVSLALLRPNQNVLNSKYLKYVIESKHGRKELYKRTLLNAVPIKVNMGDIGKIIIPVPPLSVQEEIVRILDDLTEKTDKLISELNAELDERKKEYEYYQNKLLTFNDCRSYILSELVDFRNGKGHEKHITEAGRYVVVNSKFISTQGCVQKFSNMQICPLFIGDILMVMSDLPNGRALAKCFIVDEDNKYTLNQRIGAFKIKDQNTIMSKFLYYILNRNQQLLKYDNGVDQTNLRKESILNINIPVPSISVQEKIIKKLSVVEKSFASIFGELENEITTRKKQYEYYRDKLLTF